ncbi:MAG: sigma-E processing peptidase SpoIIGA [Firmicutes bacterium]|nr:sigma-E processing peptidase SpoIIGA [Bacillota bacterium]
MQVIQVYLDQPLMGGLLSWIQDAILLWVVAQIVPLEVKGFRYIIGGAIGGIFQFFLLTNFYSQGVINSWVTAPVIFLIIVPLLMVGLAFFPLNLRKILRTLGYVYLISFFLAGIHWGFDNLNYRFFHWEINLWRRFLIHIALVLCLGEIGWGVIHRKAWEHTCLYSLRIRWGESVVKLTALLDTGNRLECPFTKEPVIIVESKEMADYLPGEVLKICRLIESGAGIEPGFNLSDFWQKRIRILPFKGIGWEQGVLVGFRPDEVQVWQKKAAASPQKVGSQRNVVVGLYNRPLSAEGAFQALISPGIINN